MNAAINHIPLTSFPNNFPVTDRFGVHTLEWMETQRSCWNGTAKKLSHFELIWIKKGGGSLEVDGQEHTLTENSIVCISPGHTRKWNMEPVPEGYYLSFTLEFLQLSEGYSGGSAWLRQYTNSSNITMIVIDGDMQFELDMLMRKMKWEFVNYCHRRLEVLKGLLNIC